MWSIVFTMSQQWCYYTAAGNFDKWPIFNTEKSIMAVNDAAVSRQKH